MKTPAKIMFYLCSVFVIMKGQLSLNGVANISQVDIPAKNGLIHHIDSLVVPYFVEPLLPHRCDITTYSKVKVNKKYHFIVIKSI